MKHHRIVAKFGTNLLTGDTDRLDLEVMASLVGQVAKLHRRGLELLVVTSGAVAAGRQKLGMPKVGKDVPTRQVMAAAGQNALIQSYEQLFAWHGIHVAQTLLTKHDLTHRLGYLNARNTLLALLELRVVPIVNENDVVWVEELEGAHFGDNDNLSAMAANLVDADLLVFLGDVAGLYTADPARDANATLIPVVDKIDADIQRLAGGTTGRGIGGMVTKIQAAKLATGSGTAVIIAEGREPNILVRAVDGDCVGTLFSPATTKMESRKRFLRAGLAAKGTVVVDDGAVRALREQNRSLLPAGVKAVEGVFERGDVVSIVDSSGERIASGIANYSSADLAKIKGAHSDKIESLLGYVYGEEAVHRDNLVLV